MIRARLELALSALFAALTVATLIWPTWIESLTGLEPDRGTGETEWWIVVLLGLVTIALGALAARDFRAATRLRTQRASDGP